jgi:hypothetical protein
MRRPVDDILRRLRASKFRATFQLDDTDARYVAERPADVIRRQAAKIVLERLAPSNHPKDGKQTPWRGHPVFVAQHATATCCRGCLAKWHGIPKGHALSADEQAYVVEVLAAWIASQCRGITAAPKTPTLFD